jgi:hypothetical protein
MVRCTGRGTVWDRAGYWAITNSGRLDPSNCFNCVLIKCSYQQITRVWRSVGLRHPWTLWGDNNFRKHLAFGNSNKGFPSTGSWLYLPTTSFWLHLHCSAKSPCRERESQAIELQCVRACVCVCVCVWGKTKVSFATEMEISRADETVTGGCNWTVNRKFILQPFYRRPPLVTTYLLRVQISELGLF